MASTTCFRQVNEKHLQAQIAFMTWSPRMDLLAMASYQSQVLLYRLSWQRVWIHQAPRDSLHVVGLSWRPDGLVLAVGYSNGIIQLLDVETAHIIHEIILPQPLLSVEWIASKDSNVTVAESETSPDLFVDMSDSYLPKLLGFAKSYSRTTQEGQKEDSMEDAKKIDGQTGLNLLLLVTEDLRLYLFAYGIVPVAVCDLSDGLDQDCQISTVHAYLSEDLRLLSVMLMKIEQVNESSSVLQLTFDTSLLASRAKEIQIIAKKFGRILSLGSYLETCMEQLKEAWEDILLEMDSKLIKLAEDKYKLCSGAINTDFLRLFMLGTASDELKTFLLHDLTDKGLKKLVLSVQSSYGNMQKLLVKHIFEVCQALMFHFEDVRGMSLWFDRFGLLGLTPQPVQESITAVGSFSLKVQELQQVIDESLKSLRAFFRWLYVAIQRLSGDKVTSEYSRMSQQEMAYVASFLKNNFNEQYDSSGHHVVRLEKIAQYLKSESLMDPVQLNSQWAELLQGQLAAQQTGLPLIYPSLPDKSLVQVHEIVKSSVDKVLNNCALSTGQSVRLCLKTPVLHSVLPSIGLRDSDENIIRLRKDQLRVSQMSKQVCGNCFIYTALLDKQNNSTQHTAYIIRQSTTGERIKEVISIYSSFPSEQDFDSRCSIVDISFYNSDFLSLLLSHPTSEQTTILAQLPLSAIEHHLQCFSDLGLNQLSPIDVKDSLKYRCMDKFPVTYFAVSGTRNVACVMASGNSRLRLFLMDADEDEDDDEKRDLSHSETVTDTIFDDNKENTT